MTNPGPEILGVPAASVPETRAALARWGHRAVGTCAVGVLCLAGFLVAIGFISAANDDLRQHGARTTGSIYTLYPDSRISSGHADVRFLVDGDERFGTVDLGSDADLYSEGQRVTVYYDLADPSRMTIDEEDNQPEWTVLPMVVLLVGAFCALVGGCATTVQRKRAARLLAASSWDPVRVRVVREERRSVFGTPDGVEWRASRRWPTYDREPRGLSGWGLPDEDPDTVPRDQPAWWVHDGRTAVFSPDRGAPLVVGRRRRDRIR